MESPQKQPEAPFFFKTYDPFGIGRPCGWWWKDYSLNSDEHGPFAERSDAEADWAVNHFNHHVQAELKSLNLALGSPVLQAPAPCSRQEILDCKLNELALNVELDQSEFIGLTEQALAITESLQELAVETSCQPAFLAAGALSAELRGNLLLAEAGL